MNRELRVLMLEDTPADAELMVHELRRAGITFTSLRVETRDAFIKALEEFRPDIVLSDYKLPDFNGMDALEIVLRNYPEVPVVMVTGALRDIEAVDLIHAGAIDYVLKDQLARLAPAVQRALSAEQGVRDRKVAEKALRESEAKFRALVESTSDWIWEINEQVVYSYASPQVYDLLGYTAEEMIGKSPFSLMPQDESVRVSAIFSAIMAAGKPIRLLESAHLHKDGRVVFMETSGAPLFDAEGVLRGYRGINRDITGRRQMEKNLLRSEAKFRTVYESSSDAIMLLDEKGFFDCNQAALRMFGCPTRDDFINKHPSQLSPPTQPGGEDSMSLANEHIATAFKNGSNQFEWMHCRLDGSEFPAEVLLTRIEVGSELFLQATVRDITERKRLEQQLYRRLRHRDIMERINQLSLNSASIEELLGSVLDEILAVFNADRAFFLYPCDPDAPSWSVPIERTRPEWPGALSRGMVIPMNPEVAEVFRELFASTDPLSYGPTAPRPSPASVDEQFSVRSQIQMALRPRVGSPWVMGLHHCAQARTYDEDELLIFKDIGQRVADALSSMITLKNLRESKENLNRAQAIGQIGSWFLDIPTNRLEWSAETYRMFGIPQQQAIDLETFVAIIHPDDRDFVLTSWGKALAGAPYDIECRIVVDGQTRWVRERAQIERDLEGRPLAGIGTAQDITERKLAEATRTQLAAIVESSNDAIIGKTPDGIITSWNKGAEAIYGYTADEIIGKHITTLAPPSHHTEIHELLEKVRKGGTVVNHESERIRKDGALIRVALTLSPIRDASGNITGISTIARDVTVQKQVEEELRKYKDQLEEKVELRTADLVLARNAAEAANRAKSVFLSSMSHELRTPLNAILGFSSMMRKDPLLTQGQRENLDIINRSGENLLTLINDVLDMAKIEAGRVQLENATFDLGGMVRDVTDMMHLRAQEKGLQLLIDQSSEFPRYIRGDEARLRQVLVNLVGNAIKFTLQGGVTIRLGTKKNKISHLLIEVEDSGPGISAADQQKIFEPFVQVGETTTQKGTGLGLTITRQFVQLMGGTIIVESTPGKGSLFRVSLPLREAAETDITKPNVLEKGDVVGLAPGQPEYRILIVEDQLENQLLLAKLMESVGFQVKVAENGEQGVQLFLSWQPHLIWMDRRMPVMDGIEATRRIRELPGGHEVKIVAVTASAFMEQRDEMIIAGMDDFVRKPYRFNEIYECLTKQLGVQYTYADAPAMKEVSDVVLTAQMLAVLPPDMRRELHDALESLEDERIGTIIDQVASYDAKLHKTLSHLAGDFDYPTILKALQTN